MDLPYLRARPELLPACLFHQRIHEVSVGGGSTCQVRRLTLEDGCSVLAKSWPEGTERPDGVFESEAAGLAWLRAAGAVELPEVIAVLPELLVLEWVETTRPSVAAARRFGRELAELHLAGAERFGAPWPGFHSSLPQDNGPSAETAWPEWFATRRIAPYLRISVDRGALDSATTRLVEQVMDRIGEYAGPPEPVARLHGDLWPGNLLWAAPSGGGVADRVLLVDPAAHGGHRETDLAQLAMFGAAPHLEEILASYQERYPLAAGWPARRALHQLPMSLLHTALFGASYRDLVRSTARSVLTA